MCVYPPCAGLLIGLFRLDLLPITPVLRVFCTFSPKFDYFGENVQKTRSTGVIGNKSSPKGIHSITIPSLFVGGVIFMLSGFVYKLFGALNFNKYFDKDNSSISLIKDRFSICSSMDDI